MSGRKNKTRSVDSSTDKNRLKTGTEHADLLALRRLAISLAETDRCFQVYRPLADYYKELVTGEERRLLHKTAQQEKWDEILQDCATHNPTGWKSQERNDQ